MEVLVAVLLLVPPPSGWLLLLGGLALTGSSDVKDVPKGAELFVEGQPEADQLGDLPPNPLLDSSPSPSVADNAVDDGISVPVEERVGKLSKLAGLPPIDEFFEGFSKEDDECWDEEATRSAYAKLLQKSNYFYREGFLSVWDDV